MASHSIQSRWFSEVSEQALSYVAFTATFRAVYGTECVSAASQETQFPFSCRLTQKNI